MSSDNDLLAEEALFEALSNSPSEELRLSLESKIIRRYEPLVGLVMSRMNLIGTGNLDRDDFRSLGLMGLLSAIRRFEPSRGNVFSTYAYPKIRGAILDGIRKNSWVSRRGLEKVKEAASAGERSTLDPGELKELQVLESRSGPLQSLDQVMAGSEADETLGDSIRDGSEDLDAVVEERDLLSRVSRIIEEMEERDRTVLSLYYFEDLTLSEIGKIMGVTESRVSQLRSRAVDRLKRELDWERDGLSR